VISFSVGMVRKTLLATAFGLVLAGCSDDNGSSSVATIGIKVQVGQEDINDALVRRVVVDESGRLPEVEPGVFNYAPYFTDDQGYASVTTSNGEIVYVDVYGRRTSDGEVSLRRCQLVAGCGSTAFGSDYELVGAPGWRSVAAGLTKGELIRVTPLTDLAAELAYDRVFSENSGDQQDGGWLTTGYYSVYSVVQAESQLSRLFGISSVQSAEPADLAQIDQWKNTDITTAKEAIRYGAIVAAWQSYELGYTATTEMPFFASAVAADLVTNDGQLYQRGGSQTLSLYDLYGAAIDNLDAVTVSDSRVQGYVDTVISELTAEREAFVDGELTSFSPASLATLLGDDLSDYELGLKRTKAFVEVLRDYGTTFFEDGYRAELDKYGDLLQAIGDDNVAAFDEIVVAVTEIVDFYRDCYLSSGCPAADSGWGWYSSHSYSNGVLTLNGGALTVSQAVADVNLLDGDDSPTSSQGIDVVMVGRITSGDLRLVLDNAYNDDDSILSSTGVRIFYESAVSTLQDPVAMPALGYQIRWSDFELYNTSDISSDKEMELTGTFSLTYQGVDDPDGAAERRFNMSEVVLNSRISDKVDDDAGNDSYVSTLFVSAAANQAEDFYPDSEFSSFNAFFEPSGASQFSDGYVSSGLVTLAQGEETIRGLNVQYLDYFVEGGESFRYRFYPTVMREDVSDLDFDADYSEMVATSEYEACTLTGTPASPVIGKCAPKERLAMEQDVQEAVNRLWALGVFSRPEVAGEGVYFVALPVAAADENGCLNLDALPTSPTTFDGTLYRPAQLGLSSARVTSEVVLNYSSETEPKTLLDIQVSAPYKEQMNVALALSHDYTGVDDSTVFTGTGRDIDRLIFNFSNESGTVNTSSLSVYKDGVSLTYADGTTATVDSEILAGGRFDTLTGAPVYRYIVGEDGTAERCVVSNTAEPTTEANTEDAVYVLNFRDNVYGKVANESGTWYIRYIDGTWETLN